MPSWHFDAGHRTRGRLGTGKSLFIREEPMVSLYPGVDAAAVWSRLPQRYRTIVDMAALGAGPIDLLVFETGAAHVVTLEELEKARRGIESSATQLAVIGYDFTEEARARIGSLGGFIFAEQNVSGWTDRR